MTVLRLSLVLVVLLVLAAPGFTFFSQRGALLPPNPRVQDVSGFFFPLVGLYAFTLLWIQFMLGSSAAPLRRVFPQVTRLYRRLGVFVFSLAAVHVLLVPIAVGPARYLGFKFLSPELRVYAALGSLAFLLMILTVSTALLWRLPFLRRRWRTVHLLNYVVFVLVWIHSWFLGSDIRTTSLKYLWIFFGVTAAGSARWRLVRRLTRRTQLQAVISAPTTPRMEEASNALA